MNRNLKVWFVPSFAGDFRLTPLDDKRCRLTVEDPTSAEVEQLRSFIRELRIRGAIDDMVGIAPKGRSEIDVNLALSVAAPLLVGEVKAEAWTAIRSVGGSVELVTSGTDDAATAVANNPDAQAAVTFNPPHLGCPAPLPCNYRASQVLRTFVTASQWSDWTSNGRMRVVGNQTGTAYTLFHRDAAARRGMAHALVDGSGNEVCVYDPSVPAEEEALSIKLTLEHREDYIAGRV